MKTENKKLLVVGGTGFIGKNFVTQAVLNGYSVTVLSSGNTNKNYNISDIEYLIGDITDEKNLYQVLNKRRFTHVINLGGYVNHSCFFSGGSETILQHFDGVRNIVHCLNWDTLECYLQIGSSDEYGNTIAPQNECMREKPISPYSFGKTASTHFLQMLHSTKGFPSVICRLFLVYGPGQNFNRFLPQVISASLLNKSFSVSAGEQERDFCYITDVIDALFIALNEDKAKGELFNIASGIPITIRSMVEKVTFLAGGGKPQFGKIPYRKGENMSLYADISKAKKFLNWFPKIDLEVGLQSTLNFYSGKK